MVSEDNASNISLNRVSPLDEDNPLRKVKNRRLMKREMTRQSEANSTNINNE